MKVEATPWARQALTLDDYRALREGPFDWSIWLWLDKRAGYGARIHAHGRQLAAAMGPRCGENARAVLAEALAAASESDLEGLLRESLERIAPESESEKRAAWGDK